MKKITMNKSKAALILLIVAFVCACLVYFTKGVTNGRGEVIYEMEAGRHCYFDQSDGNLIISGQEGLFAVDKSGAEQYSITKSLASPIYSQRGDYKLFYDRKGTTLMYFKGDGQPKTITADHPIITAKINSVGNIAIATMETGYKGKIEVFNHKGEAVYKWQIGNSYVVDMDISSDCKRLCVALLSMTGENVGSRIVMINLDKAEIVSDRTIDNNIPFQVKFTKSNIAVIVSDTGVFAVDKSGKDKRDYHFGDRVLESYKICDNGSAAFEFHGASTNGIIELYNSSGKKCGEYVSQNQIVALDATEHTVAVTDGRFIKLLNWHGGDKGVIKSETDLKDLVILDTDTIAAIGNNTVEAINY